MEISIIIVNYNTKKLTLDCIKSILALRPKVKYEIIVVDNNSNEGFPKSKSYTLIANKSNLGFAKANNQGIKIAQGKYVLLLNSDTIIKDNAIDKLYEFAKSHLDAGVVAPKLLNKDGSIQDSVFHFPTLLGAIKQYWLGQPGNFGLYTPRLTKNPEQSRSVDAVVGAAFLITPQALEKIGGLNEKYFFYYEDLDYCKKVHEVDLKVYYLPDIEIIHFKGASGKRLIEDKNQWKRLIPSSKIYNGILKHYILFFIMWLGQKIKK